MIVAPSLVMTMSPMPATSIWSMPLGPMVDRTVSARTFAAMILFFWASLPLDRELPSFRIRTRTSDVSNHTLNDVGGFGTLEINICRGGFAETQPCGSTQ